MLSQIYDSLGAARTISKALLIVYCVLGAACRVDAARTSTQHATGSSPRINSYFAIADFDGDRKPDLATVEVQAGISWETARYSIRFQLTTGAAQVFGVNAPAGGLQIVARDVNGDSALDLLVSTAWQHQQVAVLLNDGHGKFTLADPGAFPDAMRDSQAEWSVTTIQIHDRAAIPSSWSSAKAGRVSVAAFLAGDDRELTPLRDIWFRTARPDFACAGRAPPFAVLHV
jgi:hypothetical protein